LTPLRRTCEKVRMPRANVIAAALLFVGMAPGLQAAAAAAPPVAAPAAVPLPVPPPVAATPSVPLAPQAQYPGLFQQVAELRLYEDSKLFADASPRVSPGLVMADYAAVRPNGAAALRVFVARHFVLPGAASAPAPAPAAATAPAPPEVAVPIGAHIDALWSELTRHSPAPLAGDSLLAVPRPFVVPGGRFRELYYWDSYFTMLGLARSGRQDLLAGMVADFAALIDAWGHVPNGTRSYYLTRSQPPFFYAMVGLLTPADPAAGWVRYLPQLRREHAFWMAGEASVGPGDAARRVVRLADGMLLNRYWDDADTPRDEAWREDVALAKASGRPPAEMYRALRAAAESGWDFSSRWLADGHTLATIETPTIAPVDLNSLLAGLEAAIEAGCQRAGDRACAQEFKARLRARRAAIDRHLWDARGGRYLDLHWASLQPVPRVSAATVYPLFARIASHAQARRVAATLRRELLVPGGLATTTLHTGQQWDAPNGWAPLQWLAIEGLRAYGERPLAALIACRWMAGVNRVYAASGKLVEKYDMLDAARAGGGGEYPTQDGFGWTNGVMRELLALYPGGVARPGCGPAPRT
jgi:alpha,alpha-trehalase